MGVVYSNLVGKREKEKEEIYIYTLYVIPIKS